MKAEADTCRPLTSGIVFYMHPKSRGAHLINRVNLLYEENLHEGFNEDMLKAISIHMQLSVTHLLMHTVIAAQVVPQGTVCYTYLLTP